MAIASKLTLVSSLLVVQTARAQPIDTPDVDTATTGTAQVESDADLRPPSSVIVEEQPHVTPLVRKVQIGTTARWGGGIRLTGMSGIGALPGVNLGGEVAVHVRHDEYFGELGLGRWHPQTTYVVTETPEHVELGLDVWTARAGWASMKMPLRGWVLAEVGEIASARGMQGVVSRMVMGDTPQDRQWRAAGAGLGIAWPMSDNVRLIGNMEIAIPLNRERLMLDRGEAYQPDPIAARYSLGLEVGWR
jgi:hypothetical protein